MRRRIVTASRICISEAIFRFLAFPCLFVFKCCTEYNDYGTREYICHLTGRRAGNTK